MNFYSSLKIIIKGLHMSGVSTKFTLSNPITYDSLHKTIELFKVEHGKQDHSFFS